MEEVWKDITIASLPNTPIIPHHTIHHPTPTSHHYRGMILQDFLNNNNNENNNGVEERRSSIPEFLSPTNHSKNPSSSSSSNLNTQQEFQFFNHQNQISKQGNNSSVSGLLGMNNAGYDALVSSSVLNNFGGGGSHGGDGCRGGVAVSNNRKRFSESGDGGGSGGGGIGGVRDEDETVERRHKRMIKNRESAARSRARKQAYITELEMEVAHLSKENAMLRKQQRQIVDSPPSHQHPKKYGLHRASTAPF